VSGREKVLLDEWFGNIPNLSIASEHGYFYKLNNEHIFNEPCEWKELFHIKDW